MADATANDIKKVREDISNLSSRLGKIEATLELFGRELGVREGKLLDHRLGEILQSIDAVKRELNEVKIDTTQIRRTQEFGSRDNTEIKRALAAIYRNTDELEKNLINEDPETSG